MNKLTNSSCAPVHSPADSEKEVVYSSIGRMLTAWVADLKARENLHNSEVLERLERLRHRQPFDRTRTEQAQIDALRKTLRIAPSVTFLKSVVPGVSLVLAGSPKMDTGAAFMLLGLFGDLKIAGDTAVSCELLSLVNKVKGQTVLTETKSPRRIS